VGITRAKERLYLSHAWARNLWGRTQQNIPSRFLQEVPAELIDDVGGTSGVRYLGSPPTSRAGGFSRSYEDRPAVRHGDDAGPLFGSGRAEGRTKGPRRSTGAEALGLVAGDAVVHDHWGEGVVVSTKGEGDMAQATVRFDSVGEKRLLLSATPIKKT